MPTHLANRPVIQITRTILNNMGRLHQGYLYKTEDKERYQQQVRYQEIDLLDYSNNKNEGGVASANAGAQGREVPKPPDPMTLIKKLRTL